MSSKRYTLLRWSGLLVVLLLWSVYAAMSPALPGPLDTAATAWQLLMDGTLVRHILDSVFRVLIGYAIGMSLGVVVGLSVNLIPLARQTIYYLIEVLRPTPAVAWLPIAVLWFGVGETSMIFIIVVGVFFPVFVSSARGIMMTDPILVRCAQSLGASRWRVVRDVVLLSALPEILTGGRTGLSLGFIYMVAAEMIGAKSGLGYMIMHARMLGLPARIVVGMLLIGLLNLGFSLLQRAVERRALRWHTGLAREEVR